MERPTLHRRLPDTGRRGLAAICLALALGAPDAVGSGPSITATWTGLELRTVCERLATLLARPVLLDRRVDPATPVTLDLRGATAEEAITRLCRETGCGCVVLGESIRVVPPGLSAGLLAAEDARARAVARLPARPRGVAEARAPWTWGDGATPRALIEAAARDGGLVVEGIERLPHDHLHGMSLPPLPLAERVDLVLVQYGLRLDWPAARATAGRVRVGIVAIDGPEEEGPPVVAARGAWESLRGGPRPVAPEGGATWSLEVAAPLDRLLATVADRLGLTLELDRDGLRRRGIPAGEIVRLAVRDVTRDQLLDRIVEPLGLVWSIEGTTLRVTAPAGE